MNKYIGTKLIEAERATLAEAQALKTGACDTIEEARELTAQMVIAGVACRGSMQLFRCISCARNRHCG